MYVNLIFIIQIFKNYMTRDYNNKINAFQYLFRLSIIRYRKHLLRKYRRVCRDMAAL